MSVESLYHSGSIRSRINGFQLASFVIIGSFFTVHTSIWCLAAQPTEKSKELPCGHYLSMQLRVVLI